MAKNTKNYLDFVPVCNPEFEWTADRDGLVTVHVIHKGICAAVAQKVFHTPRISHIHLDRYGSYLWQQIDGKWYYFYETPDGTQGAMAANTWINGHYVNGTGVRVD